MTLTARAERLIERVRADVKGLGGPQAYAPGLKLGFTGDVAVSSDLSPERAWASRPICVTSTNG